MLKAFTVGGYVLALDAIDAEVDVSADESVGAVPAEAVAVVAVVAVVDAVVAVNVLIQVCKKMSEMQKMRKIEEEEKKDRKKNVYFLISDSILFDFRRSICDASNFLKPIPLQETHLDS